jgi:ribosomal RNA-processing protein 9
LARSEDGPSPRPDVLEDIAAVTGADPEGLAGGYCNWITAIAVMPNSDVVATGSGDGFVRFWRLAQRSKGGDKGGGGGGGAPKPVSAAQAHFVGLQHVAAVPLRGIINGLCFSGDGRFLAAAVGSEHRLGRWWRYRGPGVRNGPALIRMPAIAVGGKAA